MSNFDMSGIHQIDINKFTPKVKVRNGSFGFLIHGYLRDKSKSGNIIGECIAKIILIAEDEHLSEHVDTDIDIMKRELGITQLMSDLNSPFVTTLHGTQYLYNAILPTNITSLLDKTAMNASTSARFFKLYDKWIRKTDNWTKPANFLFIALEYQKMGDLLHHITHITNDDLDSVLLGLLLILHTASIKYGFIHRDLKPENILVYRLTKDITFTITDAEDPTIELATYLFRAGSLVPKLIDFGASYVYETYGVYSRGTLGYLAPEILATHISAGGHENFEEDATIASDIWCVGLIALQAALKKGNLFYDYIIPEDRNIFSREVKKLAAKIYKKEHHKEKPIVKREMLLNTYALSKTLESEMVTYTPSTDEMPEDDLDQINNQLFEQLEKYDNYQKSITHFVKHWIPKCLNLRMIIDKNNPSIIELISKMLSLNYQDRVGYGDNLTPLIMNPYFEKLHTNEKSQIHYNITNEKALYHQHPNVKQPRINFQEHKPYSHLIKTCIICGKLALNYIENTTIPICDVECLKKYISH